jgi:hypothetical protein
LELKLKLFGLSEDLDTCKCRAPKKKNRLLEINTLVEKLIKASIPESSQNMESKPALPNKKKKGKVDSIDSKTNSDAKTGLRQHLNKKMLTGEHTQMNKSSSAKGANDQRWSESIVRTQTLLDNESDVHLRKKNQPEANSKQYVLDKDNNVDFGLKEGEQITELSSEQCNILLELFENNENGSESILSTGYPLQSHVSAKQESLSPATSTSNMLERLLRRSGRPSASCSDSSGMEDSTESMVIL